MPDEYPVIVERRFPLPWRVEMSALNAEVVDASGETVVLSMRNRAISKAIAHYIVEKINSKEGI